MIDLLHDAGVLTRQPFSRERRIDFAHRALGHIAERRSQHKAAVLASLAIAKVRFVDRCERIREADLDQSIVGEVSALHTAGVSGSSPLDKAVRGDNPVLGRSSSLRSLRTARNKCTRTVASLKPSA